jgi:two-component system nitrogen regulation response regulator GlnG
MLEGYAWPGNVRELQSVLKQALLRATGTILAPEFLPEYLRKATPVPAETAAPDGRGQAVLAEPLALGQFIEEQLQAATGDLYAATLRRLEKFLLTRVLQHTNGNQLQAAKILGITRGRLRAKVRDHGISIGRTVIGGPEPGE